MNDMNGPETPEDPIRKALKKLPPVNAAPDFEARLKRRLLQPSREEGVAWRILFGPRRIPTFAYSLVALIAVGYFSYYLFWRTPVAPPPVEEPRVPSMYRATPPPPPILKQGDEAVSKDRSEESAQKNIQTEPSAQSGSKQYYRDETGKRAGVELDKKSAPVQVEAQTPPSSALEEGNEKSERAKDAAPTEPALKKEDARSINERARTDETTKGAASQPPRENRQFNWGAKIAPRGGKNAAAESPLESKARQLATPSAPATTYGMQSQGMVSIPVIDSAAIRDSLRVDSLKRVEKARQEMLKKSKAKKPGG
jgi:hypothetical protein